MPDLLSFLERRVVLPTTKVAASKPAPAIDPVRRRRPNSKPSRDGGRRKIPKRRSRCRSRTVGWFLGPRDLRPLAQHLQPRLRPSARSRWTDTVSVDRQRDPFVCDRADRPRRVRPYRSRGGPCALPAKLGRPASSYTGLPSSSWPVANSLNRSRERGARPDSTKAEGGAGSLPRSASGGPRARLPIAQPSEQDVAAEASTPARPAAPARRVLAAGHRAQRALGEAS